MESSIIIALNNICFGILLCKPFSLPECLLYSVELLFIVIDEWFMLALSVWAAIILPEQSVALDKEGLAVSKKGLTLKELLQQTSHHNVKVRRGLCFISFIFYSCLQYFD